MENAEPAPMTVAERIAALQNKGKSNQPPTKQVKPHKNEITGSIAALQKTVEPAFFSSQEKYASAASNSTEEGGNVNAEDSSGASNGKVGKIKKMPPGAIPVMIPFGAGVPPSLMKKRLEREKQNQILRDESSKQHSACDEGSPSDIATTEHGDEALLSRPTIKGGKRRPRNLAGAGENN